MPKVDDGNGDTGKGGDETGDGDAGENDDDKKDELLPDATCMFCFCTDMLTLY